MASVREVAYGPTQVVILSRAKDLLLFKQWHKKGGPILTSQGGKAKNLIQQLLQPRPNQLQTHPIHPHNLIP